MSGHDPHGQYYRTHAQDHAKVNIAGRDQHIGDRYDLDLNPASAFFTGRGPGRLLMVIGLCVVLFGFAGWVSIVFGGFGSFGGAGRPSGPSAMLGRPLGSGIPVGLVYFLSFGFGGVLLAIGQSMAKAAVNRQGALLGHFVTTAVVVGAGLFALVYALGGSPVSTLVPSFGQGFTSGGAQAAAPAVLVSDADRTEKKSGLTLTVTKVENIDGAALVHLSARNSTSQSIGLPIAWFKVTDGDGSTYEADHFGSDWNEDLGADAHQAGTMKLTKPVKLGTGKLRVEFTTVMGPTGPDAIAVSGVRSR